MLKCTFFLLLTIIVNIECNKKVKLFQEITNDYSRNVSFSEYFKSKYLIQVIKSKTLVECGILCTSIEFCSAFSLSQTNENNSACEFYCLDSNDFLQNTLQSSHSIIIYIHKEFFLETKNKSICPILTTKNLISTKSLVNSNVDSSTNAYTSILQSTNASFNYKCADNSR